MALRQLSRLAVSATGRSALAAWPQLALRAAPALAQYVAATAAAAQCPYSSSAAAGLLWGNGAKLSPPAEAGLHGAHSFASAATAGDQHPARHDSTAAGASTPAAARWSSSTGSSVSSGGTTQGAAVAGEVLLDEEPEYLDLPDCSMCESGSAASLDDAAAAEVAAAAALQGRTSRPLPAAAPSEQVFKADAHYVGSKIDIYALKERPEFRGHYKKVHKGAVVLALSQRHISEQCETEGMPLDSYMVAFNYGSVVFFNAGPKMRQRHLAIAREVAADPVSSERPYVEEYCLTLSPQLPVWSSCSPDNIKLQVLDLKNLQVISQVLAQSVAMDYYSSHVERTLETFCNMNLEMQESQNIGKINKQVLLQLVAENNIVMTDIINKLGVHERFDIAWKHVNYGKIWEFLRSELEMDGRFKTLESKLNLIQDNLKYFLEILQNRKSDTLEWIIIILIGAEICLSLYDLFSKGFS